MPKDRLLELKNAASNHENGGENEPEVTIKKGLLIKMKKENSAKKDKHADRGDQGVDNFLKEVEWLSGNIDNLASKVEQIKQTHSSILSSPQINNELRQELDKQNQAVKKLSLIIQKELKVIDGKIEEDERENKEKEKEEERKPHWADLRIKKTQYRTMMQRFTGCMIAYNEHLLQHKEQCKKRIQKSLQIANQEMTEKEIDDMIEKEDPQIFSQQYAVMAQQAKLDLQELEARHTDLIKLEGSLREVKELFLQVALLVDMQGEKIDRIESHVTETEVFVEDAVKQTEEAIKSRIKTNKRKICLCSCVGVTVFILVLLIALAVLWG